MTASHCTHSTVWTAGVSWLHPNAPSSIITV